MLGALVQQQHGVRSVRTALCGSSDGETAISLANSSSSSAGTEIPSSRAWLSSSSSMPNAGAASSAIRSTRHVKALRISDGVTSGRCNAASVGASSSVDGIAAQRGVSGEPVECVPGWIAERDFAAIEPAAEVPIALSPIAALRRRHAVGALVAS